MICEEGVPQVAVEFFNPNDDSIYRGKGTLDQTLGTFYYTDIYTYEVTNAAGSTMTGTFEIPHVEYDSPIMDPDGNRIYQAFGITVDGWDDSYGAWSPDGDLPVSGGGAAGCTALSDTDNCIKLGNDQLMTALPTPNIFEELLGVGQRPFTIAFVRS